MMHPSKHPARTLFYFFFATILVAISAFSSRQASSFLTQYFTTFQAKITADLVETYVSFEQQLPTVADVACPGTTYSSTIAQSLGQVSDMNNSLGVPDGSGARIFRLNSGTYSRIVWDFGTTYDAGSEACILVRSTNSSTRSRFKAWILTSGSVETGNYEEVGDIAIDSDEFVQFCFTMPYDYRYLKITGEEGSDIYIDAAYANCPIEPTCNCGENLLSNGSFEYNNGQYNFSIPFEGSPSDTMSNRGVHYGAIYDWNPALTSDTDFMFYIDDRGQRVNNPDGNFFINLPRQNYCWNNNVDFGTRLGLEDGEEYEICFYAASWNTSQDQVTGLPDGGAVSQSTGIIKMEFIYAISGFQEVAAWPTPQ
ncbi:MAG: hypothetical protein AB8G22_20000, partial [Saprospiraceae bacterium]